MSAIEHRASRGEVIAFYEQKTAQVLRKFGPGPRVHYHSGIHDGAAPPGASRAELRGLLVAAQEALLEDSAIAWDAARTLSGEVLDAGCGLGGGSLFWAQRFGARVCAVTNALAHAPLVARFAAAAGVSERVLPVVCDAEELPGEERFDAVVSIEAGSYFDRPRWFARVARLLRPRGRVFLVDTILGRAEVADFFDPHWKTHIGPLEEYDRAALDAGLRLVAIDALNPFTAGFWPLAIAWTQKLLAESAPGGSPRGSDEERLRRSLDVHDRLHRAYLDHGLRHLRMTWEKPSGARALRPVPAGEKPRA
jgi:SAM-dependent methyltransferase